MSRLTGSKIRPSEQNACILINFRIVLLDVPKHGNKRDRIHLVTL